MPANFAMRAVGVVVPAHDEEALLPRCLEALEAAAASVPAPIEVLAVVVLDACTDATAEVVAHHQWIDAIAVNERNVGAARRAGVDAVLGAIGGIPADQVWLSTTDADSVVPPRWLTEQLRYAENGWEVAVGTVQVDDWSPQPIDVARRWGTAYRPVVDHPHVHGANLGCTAAVYLEAGGWPALVTGEDVALVAAMSHRRVLRTADLPVVTSARRDPRAVSGFGSYLRDLAG